MTPAGSDLGNYYQML